MKREGIQSLLTDSEELAKGSTRELEVASCVLPSPRGRVRVLAASFALSCRLSFARSVDLR